MELTVTMAQKENGHIIVISGALDTDTYKDFEKKVTPIIEESPGRVVIDMRGISYVSSMGIGILIKTRKVVEENGGAFAMTNLQPQIKKVFDVVKALPGVSVFKNVEEADDYFDKVQRGEVSG